MPDENMSLEQVGELAASALEGAGASPENAASVSCSTVRAERDGIRSHGLLYVPIYAEHVVCGKVDGKAIPDVKQSRPGAISVDAASGFAHPAIDAGWELLTGAARENGQLRCSWPSCRTPCRRRICWLVFYPCTGVHCPGGWPHTGDWNQPVFDCSK